MLNRIIIHPTAKVLLMLIIIPLFSVDLIGDDDKSVAFQVQVTLKNGAVFDAIVRDHKYMSIFKVNSELDLAEYDPNTKFTLEYILGMNGKMGVRVENLKLFKVLIPITSAQLKDIKGVIQDRVNLVREREVVRLQKIKERRVALKKLKEEQAKEDAKQREILDDEKSLQDKFVLMQRFPPEEGWGKDKKEELYRRGVVIGIFPDENEQFFLDNYDEWQSVYKEWVAMKEKEEEEKKQAEEKKKSEQKSEDGEGDKVAEKVKEDVGKSDNGNQMSLQ